jgi:hypothetical protein
MKSMARLQSGANKGFGIALRLRRKSDVVRIVEAGSALANPSRFLMAGLSEEGGQ